MSLYGFGKLLSPRSTWPDLEKRLAEEADRGGFAFVWDVLDEDDRASLDEVSELHGEGRYFALYSSPSDTDATELWIEAMSERAASRLARAVASLVDQSVCLVGSLALVDGGIEEVLPLAPEEVTRTVLEDSRVPWDQGPNRLYLWNHTPPARSPTASRGNGQIAPH